MSNGHWEIDLTGRHAATLHLMKWLRPNQRLEGLPSEVSQGIWETAKFLCTKLGDGAELSAGLRKLREAKDCFVLQALEDGKKNSQKRQQAASAPSGVPTSVSGGTGGHST